MVLKINRLTLSFVLIALVFTIPAQAQVAAAELSGTVTDTSGALIPNVKVVATNAGTRFARETVTNASGSWVMTLLPPGNYSVSAEGAGFQRLVRTGIDLQVNQRATLNLSLEVGAITQTMEVTAAAPLLDSQSSSMGTVIGDSSVNELPLNGRNFVQLAVLSPGVNGVGYSVTGTIMSGTRPDDKRPGTELLSNGNAEGSNDFMYDGIDNNERNRGMVVLRPAVEAVREFKVQTSMFSAESGRNSGAQVDIISKSGTNAVHGSVFEFLRNSAMDARNFFNTKGLAFPPFRYNQFGFAFGGPVYVPKIYNGKNRTFFFVDYEGYRQSSLTTTVLTVPSTAMKTGDFSAMNRIYDPLSTQPSGASYIRTQFPLNIIPASRFDGPAKKLVDAYPAPQTSAKINNYTSNTPQTQRWDQGDVRIDHQFSVKDTFFARWSIQDTLTHVPNTLPPAKIPGIPFAVGLGYEVAGDSSQPTQHVASSWVHVLAPTLINEVRAGFARFKVDYAIEGEGASANLGNLLGVPNSNLSAFQNVMPTVQISNYASSGMGRSLPIYRVQNTFQFVDNITYTRSAHTFKAGMDLRRRQVSEYQTNNGNGGFSFTPALTNLPGVGSTGDGIASMLLGYPASVTKDYQLTWPGLRTTELGAYIADDFRASRKLTLNLGLRWEYSGFPSDVHNNIANFDPVKLIMTIAGRNGVNRDLNVQTQLDCWAPRFGFAYTLSPGTVVRGGYGLFYNLGTGGGQMFRNPPFYTTVTITPGDIYPGPRMSDGFPAGPALDYASANNPTGSFRGGGISTNYTNPYAQQFNLGLEREISRWNLVVKPAYVANLGRDLSTTVNLNQPLPGPGSVDSRRPFYAARPGLADTNFNTSDGRSSYHSLQISVQKRMSHGLSTQLGYTWSHAIAANMSGQNPNVDRQDKGNVSFDNRQRLTLNYSYRPPLQFQGRVPQLLVGGWQLNGIVTMQTGLSFTPALLTTTVNTGTSSRPNRLQDGNLPADQRTLSHWFDTSAFGTPALYTYGNAGHNFLWGPGRVNFDMSLFKDFPLHEKIKVQFRAEAFNVFNTPQFGLPSSSIGSSTAGVISSTVGNSRDLQVALRFEF